MQRDKGAKLARKYGATNAEQAINGGRCYRDIFLAASSQVGKEKLVKALVESKVPQWLSAGIKHKFALEFSEKQVGKLETAAIKSGATGDLHQTWYELAGVLSPTGRKRLLGRVVRSRVASRDILSCNGCAGLLASAEKQRLKTVPKKTQKKKTTARKKKL